MGESAAWYLLIQGTLGAQCGLGKAANEQWPAYQRRNRKSQTFIRNLSEETIWFEDW